MQLKEIRIKEPNQDLINQLNELMELAKTGELQGWAGVFIFGSGTTDDGWIDPPKYYQTTVVSDRMIGALHRCIWKLCNCRWESEKQTKDEP